MVSNEAFTWSNRCYCALLFLYPAEFRIRFGKEMAQVFRDCCQDEAGEGGLAGLARLWLATFRDLGLSIPREQVRVALKRDEVTGRAAGLIDSFVILSIIGSHLFVAGSGIAAYIGRNYATDAHFFTLTTMAGTALGGVGVICSVILTRVRRIHYRFIDLR